MKFLLSIFTYYQFILNRTVDCILWFNVYRVQQLSDNIHC